MPQISRRASSLGTENAFVVLAEVNALARQGRDIISFCIGQPDFPAPDNVQEAAIRAIKSGKHGYTPSAGIDELREAAARYLAAMRGGLPIRAQDVVVGAGAKPFIAYAVLSTTDYGAGDEVIYPNPGFPIYASQIVASAGLHALDHQHRFVRLADQPVGRARGDPGPAGRRRGDEKEFPRKTRFHRPSAQRGTGGQLPGAGRRLLRLAERH